MKHVLIVEKATEKLIKESSNVVNPNKFVLSGIFTEFDIENRNRRFYNAANFVPCMNSLLEKKNQLGVLYGEFDHPDVFDITGKNISHAIETLTHNESSNRVDGSIALLTTHWGKEARAIINDGFPLFVSSRAAGVTDGNNNVMLKELFTYDIVVDPGFASAKVSINESLGYDNNIDVPYRIYEMNDNGVQDLHIDNKNRDEKIKMDIKTMETFLANEMAKMEFQIMEKINSKSAAPEELKSMIEKHQMVEAELNDVKKYLEFLQTKISHLVKENSKLTNELNENTLYSNHLASGLNTIKNELETSIKFTESVAKETDIAQKLAEYVAKETETTQKFVEFVAKETDITQKFVESVAKETETAQLIAESIAKEAKLNRQFIEYVANESKNNRDFVEYNAKETNLTQKFVEHVASELYKTDVYNTYIAEKVDGIVCYQSDLVNRLKSSLPLNENMNDEDNIQNLEPIDDYLGLNDEVQNNVEETEEVQDTDDNIMSDDNIQDTDMTNEPIVSDTEDFMPTDLPVESNLESDLLSAVVKVFGSDDTGIVIEVTPDNKLIIQKSGTEETIEAGRDEVEVLESDDNIVEKVNNVLKQIKEQKTLANKQPHFFTFLSEQQVIDFRLLEKETQNDIILTLEKSEYFNTQDVLTIIGECLNKNKVSYEDNLISNIPTDIKEAWNNLSKDEKIGIITESKYFTLQTKADIKSFWNTRPFAKAINGTEAKLIKESLNNTNENLSDDYVNSFLESMKNFK